VVLAIVYPKGIVTFLFTVVIPLNLVFLLQAQTRKQINISITLVSETYVIL
jgi:hypothetical protein